jgi:hypothetical protein
MGCPSEAVESVRPGIARGGSGIGAPLLSTDVVSLGNVSGDVLPGADELSVASGGLAPGPLPDDPAELSDGEEQPAITAIIPVSKQAHRLNDRKEPNDIQFSFA